MKLRNELLLVVPLLIFIAGCGKQMPSLSASVNGSPALPVLPDCNQAELVSETIPQATRFQAGEKFDKTWIIRNISLCDWSHQYSLVYYGGIGMGAPTHRVVTENMPPGEVIHPGDTTTLTLNLRAPFSPGRQIGYWKLRDPSGILFMPGNSKQDSLTVDIFVIGTVYSFADNLCQATWTLNGKSIACPAEGAEESVQVFTDYFPYLEVGGVENEPAIFIQLPDNEDSTVTATYPVRTIDNGDHLHVITACAFETPQCDLTFRISYLSDFESGIFGEWHEVSDSRMQTIDLDLSELSGKAIQLSFSIRSGMSIEGNRGYWFFPVLLPY